MTEPRERRQYLGTMLQDTPGCVDYYPGWVEDADRLFGVLQDQIAWEQHELTLYGRTRLTPRLTAWIGDSAYRYSGIDSCLANLYRDGTDSMGYHSDNEPELGPRPTIASISLGDRRRFVLRHRTTGDRWSWDLGRGDLLVMRDESQSDYAHTVPKTRRPVGPRMNLTFRSFQPRIG